MRRVARHVRFAAVAVLLLLLLSFAHGAAAVTASVPISATLTDTQVLVVDLGSSTMKVAALRTRVHVSSNAATTTASAAATDTATRVAAAAALPSSAPTHVTTASIDVLLNDQSNRKSPSCVAFRVTREDDNGDSANVTAHMTATRDKDKAHDDDADEVYDARRLWRLERSYAEQALALQVRYPRQVVCDPMQLLAMPATTTTTTTATALRANTQLYTTATLRQRNVTGVRIALPESTRHNNNKTTMTTAAAAAEVLFSGEELTAMLLSYAAHMSRVADREDNRIAATTTTTAMTAAHETRASDNQTSKENDNNDNNDNNNDNNDDNDDNDEAVHDTAVRYAVVAVPSTASLAQRQALLDAGALAGLRVVRLVHTTTAAAVQLAHMHTQQLFATRNNNNNSNVIVATTSNDNGNGGDNNNSNDNGSAHDNDTPATTAPQPSDVQYVMIYDMGSCHTEAAVFAYYTTTTADDASHDATPHSDSSRHRRPRRTPRRRRVVELVARASSTSLGGNAFDACIAQYWDVQHLRGCTWPTHNAAQHNTTHTAEPDIELARRRARLLRAAARAREMLSVNAEVPVVVEGVVPPPHANSGSNSSSSSPAHDDAMVDKGDACNNNNAAAATMTSLSTRLSRVTLSRVCAAQFAAAVRVREAALAAAGAALATRNNNRSNNNNNTTTATAAAAANAMHLSALSRLEVIGGATRMPHLLDLLRTPTATRAEPHNAQGNSNSSSSNGDNNVSNNTTTAIAAAKVHVGRTLNADEAVVLGAAQLVAASHAVRSGSSGNNNNKATTDEQLLSPHIRVRDALTYDIAVQLSPAIATPPHDNNNTDNNNSTATSRALPSWTLFAAHNTQLPAHSSLQLPNRTADFTVTFFSPTHNNSGNDNDDDDTTMMMQPRYVQHHRIAGVSEAHRGAVAAAAADENNDVDKRDEVRVLTLTQTTVVVEVAVSDSGMPVVHRAYMVATYKETTTTVTNAAQSSSPNTTVTADEVVHSGMTEATDGVSSDKHDATHSATTAATDADATRDDSNATTTTTTTRRVTRVWPLRVEHADEADDKDNTTAAATSLSSSSWPLYSANVRRDEAQQLQRRLQLLAHAEALRMRRSVLRNDVEVLVLTIKAMATTAADGDNNNSNNSGSSNNSKHDAQATSAWRSVLRDAEAWLEGDVAEGSVSNAQLTQWRRQLRRAHARIQQQQKEE